MKAFLLRLSADLPSRGTLRIGAEVAALAPTSGEPQGAFATQPDIAERSGRPFLQGRLRAQSARSLTIAVP